MELRFIADQGKKSPGQNFSMPETREREMGEVRWEQDTSSSHQTFTPSPKAPDFFGWNTLRTLRNIQVQSMAFLARTESGPFSKAGKSLGEGGEGQAGLFFGPITGLTKSSSLKNRNLVNNRKIK